MAKDDLDRAIDEKTKKDPAYKVIAKAAERRVRLGRSLQKKRELLGISRRELAAKMATSATLVDRVEHGADVQVSTLERYLHALAPKLVLKINVQGL